MPESQQSGSQAQGNKGEASGQKLSWGDSRGAAGRPMSTANQLPPGNASNTSKLIGTFAAGLIIGLLIAWAWFDLRGHGASMSATSSSTDQFAVTQNESASGSMTASVGAGTQAGTGTVSGTSVAGAAISVVSTPAAGAPVMVSVTTDTPVWAVVYFHGASGGVLGATRFGVSKSDQIELVQPTVSGQTYTVGLVTDTPDHTWGSHTDHQPVLDANGNPVTAQFTAQ